MELSEKKQYSFSSIEQSTAFKRALNDSRVLDTGFADLNAHLIDACIVNQHRQANEFKYAVVKLAWVVSKLFKKKITQSNGNILLAPAELDKDRSIGLYTPLLPFLKEKKYDLFSVEQIFSSIKPAVFLKWIIKIPAITRDVQKQ